METSPTTKPVTVPAGSGTSFKGLRAAIVARLPEASAQRIEANAGKAADQVADSTGARPILTVAAFQSSI